MNRAKPNIAARSLAWLGGTLAACSSGNHALNAGVDAGKKHDASQVAPTPMSDPEVAMDAGKNPEPGYTIYPVNGDMCPATPFPPGFEVLPTRVCPGAGGPCHDEVCHSDADCTERPRGHCAGNDEGNGAIENTRCIYEECETNADCERGMACLCGKGWRFCAKADCITDGDCPTGEHCIPIDAECSGGPFLVCTNPADQCHTAADCAGEGACLASDHHMPLVCATVICGE